MKPDILSPEFDLLAQRATARAVERHRRLGESIVVWRDGKVVVLSAEEIPQP